MPQAGSWLSIRFFKIVIYKINCEAPTRPLKESFKALAAQAGVALDEVHEAVEKSLHKSGKCGTDLVE
jgi:hypothetical protein